MRLKTVILECRDEKELCAFYARLLHWPVVFEEPRFVRIEDPQGDMGIAFQRDEAYTPPCWPEPGEGQQIMAHLDFGVADAGEMERMTARALSLGARMAQTQYGQGEWVTLLDPAGHPFCLVIWG